MRLSGRQWRKRKLTLTKKAHLAINGGRPIRSVPLPPMHPGASYYDEEEIQAVLEVLQKKSPYRFYGPQFMDITSKFENDFAKYIGVKHALAVSSGTAALHTALVSLGVKQGYEVILPAYAWISCPSAVVASGAKPVIANIDESLTIDPEDVKRRITSKTKSIMAVHIRGSPCNLKSLSEIAKENELFLLEDCAQCMGGSYYGKKVGSIGDIGTFSFQINKLITAGEGGAVVTDNETLYEKAVMFHDCGTPYRKRKENIAIKPFPGINYRITEIASAILRVQLRKADQIIKKIKLNKQRIINRISGLNGITLRRENDPDGEIGIALVMFLPTPEKARQFRDALYAENIKRPSGSYPGVIYDPNIHDGHVFPDWRHVLGDVNMKEYMPSLDLLSRAVHLDVSPLDSSEDLDDIADAIIKVANALL